MRNLRNIIPNAALLQIFLFSKINPFTSAFQCHSPLIKDTSKIEHRLPTAIQSHEYDTMLEATDSKMIKNTRRSFLNKAITSIGIASTTTSLSSIILANPNPALAAEKQSLDSAIYTILRVREATFQETRLINSGKFKDVQRNNVKLAVKFMINNYRLSDNFIAASSYLEGNRRIEAGDIGQQAVQSLYTILEYFDSADVQNLKISDSGMAGKEKLVLKGLDVARSRIDDFVALFPADVVNTAKARIIEENDLNAKEFDPEIGIILNPNPSKS